MLKIQEIREIIKLVDQSSVDEFTYEHEGSKIKLKKNAVQQVQAVQEVREPAVQAIQQAPAAAAPAPKQEAPAAEAPADQSNLHTITSPMVGTFYQSSSPESGAYVKLGSKVDENSVVCIVEAMKLFNEIEAEVKGEIAEILVKDGQLVEYGQPLFLVKPE
ncbi:MULTISPECIES: acetyl-CoA carboxylase biotin carboxyl carrier protein [Rossellomorea]|uniref:Biotin carboxyl carrier protein of acetyl-CoA carboxylase n=1 Tax=Rossellomorea marisflavi TaxID=189381 RepID=A0A0J5SVZ5_9BACI|nr:acetyl-CoA carboxylase biotin carboxyl carrier protein [Rossellomorea marisflavi]KQU59656.1 acetyl-CoA carboxylase biotin carboxyl carrier protein subunit [Bacillus sp. Leaf406]MBV6683747.1 acetyl-CoA carboxylase biotin carboxyl carrier protein [Bacillus sp. JRC01]KML01336.1 acetyl-CoA carboxylase [Rossellomorea marisflavi]KON91420.1 acetyl-CoA carboxylase [Rossellomorea marisflavi]KZE45727.1 acetyl-CoA carboxylase biotin carboxyl carrier protein subunit [Rossellomorea marisflavi]